VKKMGDFSWKAVLFLLHLSERLFKSFDFFSETLRSLAGVCLTSLKHLKNNQLREKKSATFFFFGVWRVCRTRVSAKVHEMNKKCNCDIHELKGCNWNCRRGRLWIEVVNFQLDQTSSSFRQGCQMVYIFNTKNPNLGIVCVAWKWKMLVYITSIWYTLGHLVCIVYDHLE
jgi:hypothetical protein